MEREQIKGRGAASNPRNRFESLGFEWSDDVPPDERPCPSTQFLDDSTQSIIAYNSSPDIPFTASVNPYRGCEHGCSYCYARPFHEYLGFSAGIDFESKIMVKRDAAKLLRSELSVSKWKPQMLAMSGVTDCYQPIERKLKLTRQCLEVLYDFRNPVGIVTKNRLVTRDIDIFTDMARRQLCHVLLSINSLDTDLARKMEPRTSSPHGRLEAVSELSAAGVPVGILVAPVVPGLNDHEIPGILKACYEAGAMFAGHILLRLPFGMKELFLDWVKRTYPNKASKVESRIRDTRGGKLDDARFGARMTGDGIFAEQIHSMFRVNARKYKLDKAAPPLDVSNFRRPGGVQLGFDF